MRCLRAKLDIAVGRSVKTVLPLETALLTCLCVCTMNSISRTNFAVAKTDKVNKHAVSVVLVLVVANITQMLRTCRNDIADMP